MLGIDSSSPGALHIFDERNKKGLRNGSPRRDQAATKLLHMDRADRQSERLDLQVGLITQSANFRDGVHAQCCFDSTVVELDDTAGVGDLYIGNPALPVNDELENNSVLIVNVFATGAHGRRLPVLFHAGAYQIIESFVHTVLEWLLLVFSSSLLATCFFIHRFEA